MPSEAFEFRLERCSPAATPSQELKQQSTELNRILWKARLHGDNVSAWEARAEMLEPRGRDFDWARALIDAGRCCAVLPRLRLRLSWRNAAV